MSVIFYILGILLMLCGLFGMFRFPTFYSRLMASTLIDTAGYLCILVGVILQFGFQKVSLKLMILVFTVLFINPIFTHFIVRSSWKSGNKEDVKKTLSKKGEESS